MPPPTPPSPQKYPQPQYTIAQLSEKISQITFAMVDFVKAQCAGWSLHDQRVLLLDAWRELFYLSLAEARLFEHYHVFVAAFYSTSPAAAAHTPTILNELKISEDILRRLGTLNIQPTEFKALRTIILFQLAVKQQQQQPQSSRTNATSNGVTSTSSTASSAPSSPARPHSSAGSSPCSTSSLADGKHLLADASRARHMYETAELDLAAFAQQQHRSGSPVAATVGAGVLRAQQLRDSLSTVHHVSMYTIQEFFYRMIIGNSSMTTVLTSLLGTTMSQLGLPETKVD